VFILLLKQGVFIAFPRAHAKHKHGTPADGTEACAVRPMENLNKLNNRFPNASQFVNVPMSQIPVYMMFLHLIYVFFSYSSIAYMNE
jgi:hypothetical protein